MIISWKINCYKGGFVFLGMDNQEAIGSFEKKRDEINGGVVFLGRLVHHLEVNIYDRLRDLNKAIILAGRNRSVLDEGYFIRYNLAVEAYSEFLKLRDDMEIECADLKRDFGRELGGRIGLGVRD